MYGKSKEQYFLIYIQFYGNDAISVFWDVKAMKKKFQEIFRDSQEL